LKRRLQVVIGNVAEKLCRGRLDQSFLSFAMQSVERLVERSRNAPALTAVEAAP
jgi:hypothetical protein